MRQWRPLLLSLFLMSLVYWIAASFGLFLLALRKCGIAPDSVELCDLNPIRIGVLVAFVGYAVWAFLITFKFVRSR